MDEDDWIASAGQVILDGDASHLGIATEERRVKGMRHEQGTFQLPMFHVKHSIRVPASGGHPERRIGHTYCQILRVCG